MILSDLFAIAIEMFDSVEAIHELPLQYGDRMNLSKLRVAIFCATLPVNAKLRDCLLRFFPKGEEWRFLLLVIRFQPPLKSHFFVRGRSLVF